MKIKDVPDKLLKDKIAKLEMDEHEWAIRKMFNGRDFAIKIPSHVVNMRILIDDKYANEQSLNGTDVKKVIIPDLDIYILEDQIDHKNNLIPKSAIEYRISSNKEAFPLAHVFGGTGYLCLGNIFVPNMIPLFSPQTPLETLFLYNDRYKAHGKPKLSLNKNKIFKIEAILNKTIPNEKFNYQLNNDWIIYDTLWRISNFVYENNKYDKALDIMSDIFKIVFPKK